MTDRLARARALLEHFNSAVVPEAVATENGLDVPLFGDYWITVNISSEVGRVVALVSIPTPSMLLHPDHLARLGGMLIQVSNLVRQIRALAGGNASDSSRSQTAV